MKKNNLLKLLGIAFVVAIISTGVFYGLFVTKLSSNPGNGKMLVIAAKALKSGTVIKLEDVKTIPWASDQEPKGTFQNPADLTGKTVVDPIGDGEPVLATHLATEQGEGGGIPSGMRAVSVHVTDSTGVLGLLRPGQKVDVQVVVGRGNKPEETVVRTALADLQVLSVNTVPEASSQGVSLPVVTLLAKPAEADVLALADSGARVRMTLRNPLDEDSKSRSAMSLNTVMHAEPASDKKP